MVTRASTGPITGECSRTYVVQRGAGRDAAGKQGDLPFDFGEDALGELFRERDEDDLGVSAVFGLREQIGGDESGRRSYIAISVTDTGEGISAENMKKLFQPLFTTKAKGIGLGLVVCKKLVEANGGRIVVESEPGKGTNFSVVLPVEKG